MSIDIKIKNARLRNQTGIFTVSIKDNKIVSINHDDTNKPELTIDAKGGLVTESYVIAHLHLDKVYTYERADPSALLLYQSNEMNTKKAIDLASFAKRSYTQEDISRRVTKVLQKAITYGATHIRGFVDIDSKIKLKAIKTILELKEKFKDRLELQLVAFPQEGISEQPNILELIERSLKLGADVVGGIPWIEEGKERQRSNIIKLLNLAKKYDAPAAMLVDDCKSRDSKTIDILAEETFRLGLRGRVEACHARAMQYYYKNELQHTINLLKEAKIGLVSSPHTGPYHAPLDVLERSGITVALGQDDCEDAYYPYGRCKMIEVAYLASHILRMMDGWSMNKLYDWITTNPAKIIGLAGFGMTKGERANLIVLKDKSIHEAFTNQSEPEFVIHEGKLVYERI
jgi:cytosine deaminase